MAYGSYQPTLLTYFTSTNEQLINDYYLLLLLLLSILTLNSPVPPAPDPNFLRLILLHLPFKAEKNDTISMGSRNIVPGTSCSTLSNLHIPPKPWRVNYVPHPNAKYVAADL